MSIVIGLKHEGKVYLASDSQITIEGERKYINKGTNGKLWHPQECVDIVMGSVGWVRERNIIQTATTLFDEMYHTKQGPLGYDYLIRTMIPSMFEELGKHRALKEGKDNQKLINDYLVGIKDKLYTIGSDASLIEIDHFWAIGTGSAEAINYLKSITIEDPTQALLDTIKAVKRHSIYIDYPVHITDTETKKIDVMSVDKTEEASCCGRG